MKKIAYSALIALVISGALTNAFILVDELRVGTSFADMTVIPEPGTVFLLGVGGLALLLRLRRK